MKLPPKTYFSLDEAAEKLQCRKKDLLHYGANGKLEIAAYIDFHGEKVQGPPWDDETSIMHSINGYYYVLADDIAIFERNTNVDVGHITICTPVSDIYDWKDSNGDPVWISTYGDRHISVEREQLVIFEKDLRCFIDTYCAPAGNEKLSSVPQNDHPKSMDSLLKMVITMAIRGYSYNPSEMRSKVTSDIVADADSLGLSVHPDTVKKWLKAGADMLPRGTHSD